MAHARRRFVEAKPTDFTRCDEMIKLIKKLYHTEREAKNLKPRERHRLRIKHSMPVLEVIKSKLEKWSLEALPQSPLGKAVQYMRNHWQALFRYVTDPYLVIDNNGVERQIRPIAVGKHNWLFTGSKEGGRNAALMFSIINSCKLNGTNPFQYLTSVITRLLEGQDPVSLTPAAIKGENTKL